MFPHRKSLHGRRDGALRSRRLRARINLFAGRVATRSHWTLDSGVGAAHPSALRAATNPLRAAFRESRRRGRSDLHHPHRQIYAIPSFRRSRCACRPKSSRTTVRMDGRNWRRSSTRRLRPPKDHLPGGARRRFRPCWARYPYEVCGTRTAGGADFGSLEASQRADLARSLKTTLLKYDGLWQSLFPYVLAWYQAPLDGTPRSAYHLHAECFPAYRMRGRLKYLAGTEVAAGMFVNDSLPEEKVLELQAVVVSL